MNRVKSRITLLNIITSFILQISTIISGFIIPKIILTYFGSSVNGLISSLTQFLSYISILEGGVTGVIMASLYKPLIEKDEEKISSIIKTTESFYKKIGFLFIIYTIALSLIYPIFFNAKFSYIYIMSLTIILSISLLIQYMLSLTYKTLLNADKKVYIVSISQIIIVVLNVILSIVIVKIYPNVHILKLINGLLYLVQPIVYGRYVKKYYKINKKAKKNEALIKSRWNGFAINIAAFIHYGTDITILTLFTNFETVSVYSVYALVTNGLRQLISSITSSISPTIGQSYASNNEEDLNLKMDIFEYIVFVLVFLLFSVAILLITPFVLIYTKNITDANYNQPLFGILILISEGLYLIKSPHLNLAYSANKFKEITIPAFIEAFLNIALSIVLVIKFGLIGIIIGTIVAMLYRMIFHVYFTTKLIPSRKQFIFYKKFLIFTIVSIIGIFVCHFFFPLGGQTILNWIIDGIIYSLIFALLYLIISLLFFKKELLFFKKYITKK